MGGKEQYFDFISTVRCSLHLSPPGDPTTHQLSRDSFPGVEQASNYFPYWITTALIPTETKYFDDGDVDGSSQFEERLNPK